MSDLPHIVILGGPNGAGKSTAQPFLVPPRMTFLNADNIARELRTAGTSAGPSANITAARLLIRDMERLTDARLSFCLETNLANHGLSQRIPLWRQLGYQISLFFLWLPSPDLAVARVAQRVMSGGHDIPEATIRRRYHLGWENFHKVYASLVDNWWLYDSSGCGSPHLIERGKRSVSQHEGSDFDTDTARIAAAFAMGVRAAIRRHKRDGHAIVIWEAGGVKWIPAPEIIVPDNDSDPAISSGRESL